MQKRNEKQSFHDLGHIFLWRPLDHADLGGISTVVWLCRFVGVSVELLQLHLAKIYADCRICTFLLNTFFYF